MAVAGAGAATLGEVTAAGAGAVAVAGSGEVTLGGLTAAGEGGVSVSGEGAITLGELTAAGEGQLGITSTGEANITLGALTASGTGVAEQPPVVDVPSRPRGGGGAPAALRVEEYHWDGLTVTDVRNIARARHADTELPDIIEAILEVIEP